MKISSILPTKQWPWMICIPRAEGCGPLGRAIICDWLLQQPVRQVVCEFGIFATSVCEDLLLKFCSTATWLQCCRLKSRYMPWSPDLYATTLPHPVYESSFSTSNEVCETSDNQCWMLVVKVSWTVIPASIRTTRATLYSVCRAVTSK